MPLVSGVLGGKRWPLLNRLRPISGLDTDRLPVRGAGSQEHVHAPGCLKRSVQMVRVARRPREPVWRPEPCRRRQRYPASVLGLAYPRAAAKDEPRIRQSSSVRFPSRAAARPAFAADLHGASPLAIFSICPTRPAWSGCRAAPLMPAPLRPRPAPSPLPTPWRNPSPRRS